MMFAAGKNAQERNIQALATLPAGLAGAVLADDGAAAPIVSPSSWSLAVDLAPKPFTRFAKSSAFLYGPCAALSWIIACAFTGPIPLIPVAASPVAELRCTAAQVWWTAITTKAAHPAHRNFFNMAFAPSE